MKRWEGESPRGGQAKFCGKNSTVLQAQTGRGGGGEKQEATVKITCLKAASSLSATRFQSHSWAKMPSSLLPATPSPSPFIGYYFFPFFIHF